MKNLLRLIGLVSLVSLGQLHPANSFASTCKPMLQIEQGDSPKLPKGVRYQDGEYVNSIRQVYQVNPAGRLVIDNRHGLIEVRTWDKSEVSLNIEIKVSTSSEAKAARYFEAIRIQLSGERDLVSALTQISNQLPSLNMANSLRIDYHINMPKGFSPELTHRYGNIELDHLLTPLKVDLAYGDLRGSSVKGASELKIRYGKALFEDIQDLQADLAYGAVTARSAGNVALDSRYSELHIGRIRSFRLDSKYDNFIFGSVRSMRYDAAYSDFRIDSAWNLHGQSAYSDLRIDHLIEQATLNLNYGELALHSVGADVSLLEINAMYTDVLLHLDKGLHYRLEASSAFGNVCAPKSMVVSSENKDGRSMHLVGYSGNNPKARINVAVRYGDLRME